MYSTVSLEVVPCIASLLCCLALRELCYHSIFLKNAEKITPEPMLIFNEYLSFEFLLKQRIIKHISKNNFLSIKRLCKETHLLLVNIFRVESRVVIMFYIGTRPCFLLCAIQSLLSSGDSSEQWHSERRKSVMSINLLNFMPFSLSPSKRIPFSGLK